MTPLRVDGPLGVNGSARLLLQLSGLHLDLDAAAGHRAIRPTRNEQLVHAWQGPLDHDRAQFAASHFAIKANGAGVQEKNSATIAIGMTMKGNIDSPLRGEGARG